MLALAYFTYIIIESSRNMDKYYFNYVRGIDVKESLAKGYLTLTNAQTTREETIELKGKKAIVAFATWCEPCLEKLIQYNDSVKPIDNVYFVSDERLELIQQFQKKHGIKVPLHKDTSDLINKFVDVLPTILILKGDSVLYKVQGSLSYEGILERVGRRD